MATNYDDIVRRPARAIDGFRQARSCLAVLGAVQSADTHNVAQLLMGLLGRVLLASKSSITQFPKAEVPGAAGLYADESSYMEERLVYHFVVKVAIQQALSPCQSVSYSPVPHAACHSTAPKSLKQRHGAPGASSYRRGVCEPVGRVFGLPRHGW